MRSFTHLWTIALLCCISCSRDAATSSLSFNSNATDRWAVYYDSKIDVDAFQSYDVVVLDRTYYPDFRKLLKKTIVLAYVSAGEIQDTAPEKTALHNENALFSPKNRWGNWPANLTSERWRNIVLSQVDNAMDKGFDGVMLDTIDSALHASKSVSPAVAANNRKAVVTLINQIHDQHPNIKIMLNRGFDVLPAVADKIDYVLAESILTEINLSTGQSHLNPSNSYQQSSALLRWARDLSPRIKIYTLDYWSLNDRNGIKTIYRMQREQGFSPYVTTPDLRHFTPEPE